MRKRTIKGWVEKSHKLPEIKDNFVLVYDFQSLGRIDDYLASEWNKIKNNLEKMDAMAGMQFNYHCMFARLWVISGYELVRHIRKFDKREEVEIAYQKYRRVRVPLVKFEKVKDGKKERYPSDFNFIKLAISTADKNMGWAVDKKTIITREELAQEMYDLF